MKGEVGFPLQMKPFDKNPSFKHCCIDIQNYNIYLVSAYGTMYTFKCSPYIHFMHTILYTFYSLHLYIE